MSSSITDSMDDFVTEPLPHIEHPPALTRIFHDNAEFWDNLGEAVYDVHPCTSPFTGLA